MTSKQRAIAATAGELPPKVIAARNRIEEKLATLLERWDGSVLPEEDGPLALRLSLIEARCETLERSRDEQFSENYGLRNRIEALEEELADMRSRIGSLEPRR